MSPAAGFAVRSSRVLASVMWLVGFAGCYNPPTLDEGAPCQRSEQCPDPQQCVLGRCSLHGSPPPDARPPALPDAMVDAAVDAMPPACSTAGLTCTGGTVTMFSCGGNCWVRCTASVTRETARAACAAWTGALGEIDSEGEQTCLAPYLGGLIWIGLIQNTDPANTPGTGWTWNGTTNPMTYTHWVGGQPDDGTSSTSGRETGREQCGLLRPEGTWADDPCTGLRSFFCERPQPAQGFGPE